jgi:peptidoglycan/LPS O-acetylase OafA/YrhL
MQYRADIDGLRAVSVLGVIFFHFNIPFFPGGFVGVDIFFVISGFLIGRIILDESDRDRFSLLNFYARRIRRILPALFTVIAATVLFGYFFYLPEQFEPLGSSVLATSLFVSNVFFWVEDTNYFVDAIEVRPLLHTWTLAIEEQFYVFFPVFVLAIYRFKDPALRRRLLLGGIALVLCASFALNLSWSRSEPMAAFYLAPARAWELMLGVMLATGIVPTPRKTWQRQLTGLCGAALIVLSMVTFNRHTPYPDIYGLAPCVGGALMILAGASGRHVMSYVLESRPAVLIGKISYSVYLWHWPLFTFFTYYMMRPPTVVEGLLLAVLSLAMAFVSWRFIEQPFRRRTIAPQRRQIYYWAGAATASALFIGAAIVTTQGLPWRIPPDIRALALRSNYMHPFRYCHGRKPAEIRAGNVCHIGDKSTAPSFVITGDSHADMQVPAFDEAARQAGTSGLVMTRGGCAPVTHVREAWGNEDESKCDNFNKAVTEVVLRTPSIRKVFLAGFWRRQAGGLEGHYFTDDQSTEVSPEETRKVFKRALMREITALKGKEVYIVADVPYVGYELPTMLARSRLLHEKHPGVPLSVTKATYLFNQKSAFAVLGEIAKVHAARVLYVDDVLCPDDRCDFVRDGKILYRDKDHLSYAGAMLLVHKFFAALREEGKPLASTDVH